MRTVAEWDDKIMEITSEIYQKYPELVKYISETPQTIPDTGELKTKSLEDYYNSLKTIVEDYSKNHSANK